MSEAYPDDLFFTKDHEWARCEEQSGRATATIGISRFAVAQLGDVTPAGEAYGFGAKSGRGEIWRGAPPGDGFGGCGRRKSRRQEETRDSPGGTWHNDTVIHVGIGVKLSSP